MKNFKRLIGTVIVFLILLANSLSVFAFSENESRSVEGFFIESQMLKGDGQSYQLDKESTRLEGIIILIRLLGKDAEAQDMNGLPCRFIDVPSWAAGYVNYAYESGISNGVGDNIFGTNNKMSAQQYSTLLLRVLGYNDSQGDFKWYESVEKAEQLDILPVEMALKYEESNTYTKRDIVETAFCFLEANYKDQEETMVQYLIEAGVVNKEIAEKYGVGIIGFDSISTSFNEDSYISFDIKENQLYINGKNEDDNKKWFLIHINDADTKAERIQRVVQKDSQDEFELSVSLSSLPSGEYYVDLYGNKERYHTYTSIVFESVKLIKTKEAFYFETSPVYGRNLRIFLGNQLANQDYKMTLMTRASKDSINTIRDLAFEITAGIESDYDKVKAIHDWVASNIYYDKDYLNGKKISTNINSIDVLNKKYAVCSGYSNLYHDLVSSIGIRSIQVFGYALGITGADSWDDLDIKKAEPNHVWNEVYVDGRWIIVDTTWDSSNTYEAGKFTEKGLSHNYFDTTMQFLSITHRTN